MPRATTILIVAALHGLASGAAFVFAFGIAMTFNEGHPLWWLAIGLVEFLFFPVMIGRECGLPLGPFDSCVGMVLNSLVWSVLMCALWRRTPRWRGTVARRVAVLGRRRVARLAGVLGLGLVGFTAGYLAPLFTTGMRASKINGVEEVSVDVFGFTVYHEIGVPGDLFERESRHWGRVVPRRCGAIGGCVGLVVGAIVLRRRSTGVQAPTSNPVT